MQLYPDQKDLLIEVQEAFRTHRSVLMQAPTGWGKTVAAGKMMQGLDRREHRVLILVHREELMSQFWETLSGVGLADNVGIIAAGKAELAWMPHHISSVQALYRRLETTRLRPTFFIVDEAHHATAKTYSAILNRWPEAYILGLTATPERPDGAGLNKHFETLILGPTPRELIEHGRLCPYRMFRLPGVDASEARSNNGEYVRKDLDKTVGRSQIANVVRAIQEHAHGRRTLVFSVSVRASQHLAHELRQVGYRAQHFDGNTDKFERRNLVADFRDGGLDQLCSVDLVSEGFDVPACDTVVLARPMKSLTLYLQQVGRCLRWEPDKIARILDCTYPSVSEMLGMPCAERQWSLEGRAARQSATQQSLGLAPACMTCGADLRPGEPRCLHCGTKRPNITADMRPQVDESLIEIDIAGQPHTVTKGKKGFAREDVKKLVREAWMADGAQGIRDLGKQMGYKSNWAELQIGFRTAARKNRMPTTNRRMRV